MAGWLIAAGRFGRRFPPQTVHATDQIFEVRGFGHRPASVGDRPERSRYLIRPRTAASRHDRTRSVEDAQVLKERERGDLELEIFGLSV